MRQVTVSKEIFPSAFLMVYIGMGITIVPEFWANLAKQILNLAFVPFEGDNEKITLVAA